MRNTSWVMDASSFHLTNLSINMLLLHDDEHAERIMGNCVIIIIIIPHYVYDNPSRWYYLVQEVNNCRFGVVTYGVTSTLTFMKSHTTTI